MHLNAFGILSNKLINIMNKYILIIFMTFYSNILITINNNIFPKSNFMLKLITWNSNILNEFNNIYNNKNIKIIYQLNSKEKRSRLSKIFSNSFIFKKS